MAVTNYDTYNGRIFSESTSGVQIDYLHDALGSVIATVDQTATVVNTYRYKPYGDLLAKTGAAADPKFLWVGGWGYRHTANVWAEKYVRARHYGVRQGSWVTKDPVWPWQHPYQYVDGNVTILTDPKGLIVNIIVGGLGGCVGGATVGAITGGLFGGDACHATCGGIAGCLAGAIGGAILGSGNVTVGVGCIAGALSGIVGAASGPLCDTICTNLKCPLPQGPGPTDQDKIKCGIFGVIASTIFGCLAGAGVGNGIAEGIVTGILGASLTQACLGVASFVNPA